METTQQLGQQIDNDDYHNGPGTSNSALKTFRNDPREYYWRYVLGNRERARRDAFDFGSAVHDLTLLGDDSNIRLIPDDVLSKSGSRAGKAWKEFESENYDKILLKKYDYDAVKRCVDAVFANPMANKLLSFEGPAEHMFAVKDEGFDLTLKCKPDKLAIVPNGVVVVDLKTTESVNPGAFARSIVSYDYDCQKYFYERILRAMGLDIIDFVFIAVSKQPPHCVSCYSIESDDMRTAATMVEGALGDLAERYRTGDWEPSWSKSISRLKLPRYSINRSDYTL